MYFGSAIDSVLLGRGFRQDRLDQISVGIVHSDGVLLRVAYHGDNLPLTTMIGVSHARGVSVPHATNPFALYGFVPVGCSQYFLEGRVLGLLRSQRHNQRHYTDNASYF